MDRIGIQAFVFLAAMAATEANAKLISAALPPPDESAQTALHRPTGCLARIVFSNDAFVKAQITDPKCLPSGVTARDIPGTLIDFQVTPK